ncbi:hypothetical protein AAT1_02069 [Pseudomonas phage AAT-1]|uniref:Uncharacterized protein n=1 Tax=Pseudomonas phage AAT-1 TaxID=1775248 RepID=A0A125SA99_9CAUD|nr:hypothetical protein P9A56_gp69 [Pseudomonas phage AAT-1]AME18095.1 hypothetical protein AAT1_02069 [Pseudomonas phage AAT-1]
MGAPFGCSVGREGHDAATHCVLGPSVVPAYLERPRGPDSQGSRPAPPVRRLRNAPAGRIMSVPQPAQRRRARWTSTST